MKKIIVCTALVFFTVVLTSCNACIRRWPPPYGIWHSENLNMTLFIDSDFSLTGDGVATWGFLGLYVQDGENVTIVAYFNEKFGEIYIFERTTFDANSWRDYLFFGRYRIRNDRIYFDVEEYRSEPVDMDTIAFEQLEQAELIRWFLSVID